MVRIHFDSARFVKKVMESELPISAVKVPASARPTLIIADSRLELSVLTSPKKTLDISSSASIATFETFKFVAATSVVMGFECPKAATISPFNVCLKSFAMKLIFFDSNNIPFHFPISPCHQVFWSDLGCSATETPTSEQIERFLSIIVKHVNPEVLLVPSYEKVLKFLTFFGISWQYQYEKLARKLCLLFSWMLDRATYCQPDLAAVKAFHAEEDRELACATYLNSELVSAPQLLVRSCSLSS